jgi:hypothetical protein
MRFEAAAKLFLLNVLSAVLLVSLPAFGQGIVTGSISGTVLDPQGAVVAGASVQATQIGDRTCVHTTTSSKGGVVQLPSMPPGTGTTLLCKCQGFSSYGVQHVVVEVGKDTSLGAMNLEGREHCRDGRRSKALRRWLRTPPTNSRSPLIPSRSLMSLSETATIPLYCSVAWRSDRGQRRDEQQQWRPASRSTANAPARITFRSMGKITTITPSAVPLSFLAIRTRLLSCRW